MTTGLFPSWLPVAATVNRTADGRAWLKELPSLVEELRQRWSVRLGAPFPGGSCSWVAPAVLPDGGRVVSRSAGHTGRQPSEAEALQLWDGHGAVRVHRQDQQNYALLMERCEPGDQLSAADHLRAEEQLLLGSRRAAPAMGRSTPETDGP
jgi:streptomycin 6-kinase